MKSLLEFLLIHLVDFPDKVQVDSSVEDETEVFTITVAPEDMGRVIGKNGKIINAIRSLARVRAIKEHKHIMVKLADQVA